MQTAQGNVLQSLRAVHALLDENAAELTGVVNTGARRKLDEALVQLSIHASDQTGYNLAAQGATQKKAALRAELLRDHTAPTAFVAAGLPQDFVAQLTAAADTMVLTLDERRQSRGKRGGATMGLEEKLGKGRKIVHALDTFVRSSLKDDPSLLANWNMVKRVQRPTSRAASPVPQTPTAPVAPSAAPTA